MVSSVFVGKIDKKTRDKKGIDNAEFVWVCRLCEHNYDFDFPPALDTLMTHDVNLVAKTHLKALRERHAMTTKARIQVAKVRSYTVGHMVLEKLVHMLLQGPYNLSWRFYWGFIQGTDWNLSLDDLQS